MTETMHTICPVCEEEQVSRVITANSYNQLYRCESCAHVFVSAADLEVDENRQLQLHHFGESFAARESFFIAFYEYLLFIVIRDTRIIFYSTSNRGYRDFHL